MKKMIIFESMSGAVIDIKTEPTRLQGYANHLKHLGFLTEYKNGKVKNHLQGIQRTFLAIEYNDTKLKDLPTRVTVPPFSLNKFCDAVSTHKEKVRIAQKGKSGYRLTGNVLLRREVNKDKLLKEFIEDGAPEKWMPREDKY